MSGISLMLSAAICFNNTFCYGNLTLKDVQDGVRPNVTKELPINYQYTVYNSTAEKLERIASIKSYLNGRRLKITTLHDYPLSYIEREGGTDKGKGVAFDMVDFLAKKYNFTYDVIRPNKNIIGSSMDEQYNNSMIKILEDNKADLAAAFVPYLTSLRNHILYSTTTLDEGEWIMIMKRPGESASGSGLLAPFDFWVWILILISLLIVGPVIYLMIMIRNKLTGDKAQTPYSLGHCAWFVYGALMKQGSTLSPIADSTRLLFATWWLFITILTSFYTANLTAFLTLSKFTLPFNTKDDILKAQKDFVAHRGFGVQYAMNMANESLHDLNVLITKNKVTFTEETNDTNNLNEYVGLKNWVFVRDRPAVIHMLYNDYTAKRKAGVDDERLQCPYAMAKKPFMTKKRGFAYPPTDGLPEFKNQSLSFLFDAELLNLVESGIVKYLSAKSLPNAEICPQNLNSNERQLRNGDLQMTYYIMLAGFATSMAVFFSEMLFRHLNGRREKNMNQEFLRKFSKRPEWGHRGHLLSGNVTQVTPPPPYASIFNYTRNSDAAAGRLKNIKDSDQLKLQHGVKRFINGRDYMVYTNPTNGRNQLVPVRAPSAALFQYSYTE